MTETVIETKKTTLSSVDKTTVKKIEALEKWFRYDYLQKLSEINRYSYLGIPCAFSRYDLELEAYDKENELRTLKRLEPLPAIKYTKII